MSKKWILALFGLVLLLACASALFGGEREEATIMTFFNEEEIDYDALFAPSFLNAVPVKKIEKIRQEYRSALGTLRKITQQGQEYELVFEKGKAPCRITLNAKGKIVGFWIGPMALLDDSLEKVLTDLKKMPGTVSVSILRNGQEEVVAIDPDRPLAVGSTFKLYVLEALKKKMKNEGLGWDAVIPLNESYYSLPSGFLHKWPAGTLVTLQTLAHLMISISDNTATDHLLFYVGREAVEAMAPERVRPFYSTAEMFRLKHGMSAEERERYLAADLAAKREILAGLPEISLETMEFRTEPSDIDTLEWIITARELGETIYRLRDCPSLYINPGLATKKDWLAAGYKGGSEPGVLNFTHLLRKDENSPWFSISATINNPAKPIKEDEFGELVVRLINLVQAGKLN